VTLSLEAFDGQPDAWDDFARRQVGWTHYHRHGWKHVIEETLGHECLYLVARDDSREIRGVLPLVRVRSAVFGHYLVSMPFLNYGGPLGSTDAIRVLATGATDQAQRDHVRLLELRSAVQLPIDLPASHRKITVLLDLPSGDSATLFQQLPSKVRSQVRRPLKEGVSVRFGPDEAEPFYDVFARHMRDLGTPVQSRRLFLAIREQFADTAWFGCAYLAGQPVAAGCGFRWGSEFEMTWASALTAYNSISPNMLLYWAFMERAVQQGLAVFNFGRCTPGSGTHRFKRQWGGRDAPLWWYQRAAPGTAAATPSPDDSRYAWGPRVWKRLPLRLATWLGPRIVRLIP
jgi:serine/alanine adding enzyme